MWKRDHGVAAPIGKPVIAGDERFAGAALDQEAVGLVAGESAGEEFAAIAFGRAKITGVSGIAWFGGCDDSGLNAARKIEVKRQGLEEIFLVVEAALLLF